MLTSTLRLLTAALTLMSAAAATELPQKADDLHSHAALRARHRPASELTDVCRVEPVVAAPAPIAANANTATSIDSPVSPAPTASCTDMPRARSEAPQ
jgi:hypothetical protein